MIEGYIDALPYMSLCPLYPRTSFSRLLRHFSRASSVTLAASMNAATWSNPDAAAAAMNSFTLPGIAPTADRWHSGDAPPPKNHSAQFIASR